MVSKKEVSFSKDRGKFLITVLFIYLLLQVFTTLRLFMDFDGFKSLIEFKPSGYIYYFIFNYIADWAILFGLWMNKKWGAYLFLFSFITTIIQGFWVLIVTKHIAGEIMQLPFNAIFSLTLFGVVLLAILRKWNLFK